MSPRPLTWLCAADAIYWSIRFHESGGAGRIAIAIVMGVFALASEFSNQADHEERERMRWDD